MIIPQVDDEMPGKFQEQPSPSINPVVDETPVSPAPVEAVKDDDNGDGDQ
jgi:hypothetical protein